MRPLRRRCIYMNKHSVEAQRAATSGRATLTLGFLGFQELPARLTSKSALHLPFGLGEKTSFFCILMGARRAGVGTRLTLSKLKEFEPPCRGGGFDHPGEAARRRSLNGPAR